MSNGICRAQAQGCWNHLARFRGHIIMRFRDLSHEARTLLQIKHMNFFFEEMEFWEEQRDSNGIFAPNRGAMVDVHALIEP